MHRMVAYRTAMRQYEPLNRTFHLHSIYMYYMMSREVT